MPVFLQMENYTKARTLEHPSVCPFLDLPPDTPEVRVKDGSKIRNLLRFCQSRMEARPRAAEKERRPGPEEGGKEAPGRQEGRQEAPGRQEGRQERRQEAPGRQEGRQEAPGRQEGRQEAQGRKEVQQEAQGRKEVQQEASGRQEASGQPLCTHIVFTASGKGVSKAISCAEILKRRVGRLHQLTRLQFGSLEEVWEPLEPAAGLEPLTVTRKQPSLWILLSREPLDHSLPGYQAPGRYDALWAPEGQGGDGQKQGHKRKKGERGGERGGGGVRGRGGGRGPGRQTGRS
ncbi:ribonuclease P protein subunit p25-like protein isoform X3 [Notothenia coriiceps]|uniref:Ribonuclease P protein subunit p25-like protein isoform X3 n=1 Tax=Notothenia coriiceps TaxID=8208 RepID=A0A6I9NQZ7_9TELE|nr:PREDICTED: ribonuclease P protein subunit p25-like isoform X3 [Notothenia coriiceps]